MFSLRRVSFAPKEMRQKQNQFHFAEQQFYEFIQDMYFSFSLLSWILLHSDSRLLHFVCRRRYPRYFEFHSTQNPLCAVKEKEKIPKEKEISAVV